MKESKDKPTKPTKEMPPMTLNFLGCHYETTVTEVESPSKTQGMYRGNPVQISTGCVATRATRQLTYRGVTYTR